MSNKTEVACTFTEAELAGLFQLMEAGLKSLGDPAAEAYVYLKRKFKAAATATTVAEAPLPQPAMTNGHDVSAGVSAAAS